MVGFELLIVRKRKEYKPGFIHLFQCSELNGLKQVAEAGGRNLKAKILLMKICDV